MIDAVFYLFNFLVYLFIYSLIMFLCLWQVEDAMLMFDKQTNRHRGKSHNNHNQIVVKLIDDSIIQFD